MTIAVQKLLKCGNFTPTATLYP